MSKKITSTDGLKPIEYDMNKWMFQILLTLLFCQTGFAEVWSFKGISATGIDSLRMSKIEFFIRKYLNEELRVYTEGDSLVQKAIQEKMFQEAMCDTNCTEQSYQVVSPSKKLVADFQRVKSVTFAQMKVFSLDSTLSKEVYFFESDEDFDDFLTRDLKLWIAELGQKSSAQKVVVPDTLQAKPVAILPLKAVGVSDEFSLSMTSRLQGELFKTGQFKILEREDIQEILKMNALQLTLCDQLDCTVEMGKKIGADYMILGSLVEVGTYHSLNLRMVDVQTSEVLRSGSVDVRGNSIGRYKESIEDGARMLAGLPELDRLNVKGWTWLGVSLGLGLGGALAHLVALDELDHYKSERYDLSALKSYKEKSQNRFIMAGAFYGLSAVAMTFSIIEFNSENRKIKIGPGSAVFQTSF